VDIEKLKQQLISDPEVGRLVARRAFEIYLERRDRYAAHPAEDWLRAESEILPRLIDEMVAQNRAAIESHDDSGPVAAHAAEHMREELAQAPAKKAAAKKAVAKPAAKKAAAKPAAKKAAAKPAAKPAAKKAAAKPAAKKAAAKPAAKKPAASSPKNAPKKD